LRVVKIRPMGLALVLATGLLAAGPAGAHPEIVPTLVNRYVTLTVFENRVDVLVSLLFGQLPGGERRGQMDQDRDGRIDGRELSRERLSWGRDPHRLVRVTVDRSPIRLTAATIVDLNGDRSVAPRPLLVELHGSFDLAPGERTVQVQAGSDLPRLGETEIAIDLVTGWELVASLDASARPTGAPQRLFQFPAAPAASRTETAATFVLRARAGWEGAAGRWRWGRAAWGLVAAAVAATIALAFLALRSRKPG
jgi:hypothetical protein